MLQSDAPQFKPGDGKVGITGIGKINSFVLNELRSIWPAVDTGRWPGLVLS
jgi:hypothetical protein